MRTITKECRAPNVFLLISPIRDYGPWLMLALTSGAVKRRSVASKGRRDAAAAAISERARLEDWATFAATETLRKAMLPVYFLAICPLWNQGGTPRASSRTSCSHTARCSECRPFSRSHSTSSSSAGHGIQGAVKASQRVAGD